MSALQQDKDPVARPRGRYPLQIGLSYTCPRRPWIAGVGETVHISSKELIFSSTELFVVGHRLEVSIDWPARIENRIPLKLVISGRVVRSVKGQAAMTIDEHEFRIRRVERQPEQTSVPVSISA